MNPLIIFNNHFYERMLERWWLKKAKSLFKDASKNIIKSWKSKNTGRIMIKYKPSNMKKHKILILNNKFKPVTLLDWDMFSVSTLVKYQYQVCELTEDERNLIVERTNAGLQSARARGIKGGRKQKLDSAKQKTAQTMYDSKNHTIKEICDTLKVTKPTLYKYLNRQNGLK